MHRANRLANVRDLFYPVAMQESFGFAGDDIASMHRLLTRRFGPLEPSGAGRRSGK
jgi:hypothetical protein